MKNWGWSVSAVGAPLLGLGDVYFCLIVDYGELNSLDELHTKNLIVSCFLSARTIILMWVQPQNVVRQHCFFIFLF